MLRRSRWARALAHRHPTAAETSRPAAATADPAVPLDLSASAWRAGGEREVPRARYAKTGYDFVEHLRVAGPRASLDGLQASLLFYGLAGGALVLYTVHWLTTYAVVITTDPAPQRNTMFQRFPSDYVVLVNRWTGRRRVVTVGAPSGEQQDPGSTLPYRDRVVHVNRLRDRLMVYQQPTRTAVIVEVEPVVSPTRFMRSAGADGRVDVAVRRVDQLMPDVARGGARAAVGGAGSPAEPRQLLIETEARMRDMPNGDARGNILAFRETIAHVVESMLADRLYDALLARTMAGGTRRVYAEEMIRNGTVTAEGISLATIVPDLGALTEAVFAEVTRRMGEDVLLYKHTMQWL